MDEELTGKKRCKEREKEQGGWITQNYVRRGDGIGELT